MRPIAIGIIGGVLASGIMVGEVWLNLNKPLREREDITWQYFLFDNNLKKLARGEFKNLFQARMFYPKQNTLAFGNSLLGQSLLGLPVYLVTQDVVTAANSVVVIQLWLAFMAMYLLACYWTRSVGGALIAGMVYSFNPYVMAHLHHEQLALFGLPALFLVTEVMIARGVNWRRSLIWAGLWLMLLISSFYYTLFAVVTVPIYVLVRRPHFAPNFAKASWGKLAAVSLGVAVIGWFYLQPFRQVKQEYGVERSDVLVELLSAKPQDFLFTGPQNWLYGRQAQSQWRDEFSREHPTEHSLFPGIVAVVLAIVVGWKKPHFAADFAGASTAKQATRGEARKVWWVLLGVSAVLAIGVGGRVFGLLAIRAVSRWIVIGFMSLAVLAAYGWPSFAKSFGRVKKEWICLVVLVVMIAEYRNVGWVKPAEIKVEIKQFYAWLSEQKDVEVIVELPIANDLANSPLYARSAYDDGQYLLYATLHDKTLINGHHSFIPEDAYAMGRKLTANFPTPEKLGELRQVGVDVITVHEEEFVDGRVAEKLLEDLRGLGIEEVYDGETIKAFKI